MKNSDFSIRQNEPFDVDLDTLLRPALAFEHPRDVVGDPDLTLNEQRAILASWASDACAVTPALRCVPGTERPLPVDEILEALRALDKQANATDTARYRRSAFHRDIPIPPREGPGRYQRRRTDDLRYTHSAGLAERLICGRR